jgi:hypothetical protein
MVSGASRIAGGPGNLKAGKSGVWERFLDAINSVGVQPINVATNNCRHLLFIIRYSLFRVFLLINLALRGRADI